MCSRDLETTKSLSPSCKIYELEAEPEAEKLISLPNSLYPISSPAIIFNVWRKNIAW